MRHLLLLCCLIATTTFAQQPSLYKEKLQQYSALSKAHEAQQPDSAVHYAHEAMRLAEKENDRPEQAGLLLQLGHINAIHHHDGLARRFYGEALVLYRGLQDAGGVARTYAELGLLDGESHHMDSARHDLGQAMRLYRAHKDSIGIRETFEGLGKVYREKGDLEKALRYDLEALALYEQRTQKPEAYFMLLAHIGSLYQKKGDNENALRYLRKGIADSSQADKGGTEVPLLNEGGQVLQSAGKTEEALQMYKRALGEAKKYRQPEEQARALIHIAGVLKKQDAKAGLKDLTVAMDIAKGLHLPQLQARIYEAMSGLYRQEKNYLEAMNALQEQHRLLDSLLGADTAKDIAAIDSSYALVSSREKIVHLEKINRLEKTELELGGAVLALAALLCALFWLYLRKVRRMNIALQNSNQVKDTLFSVIGHDLKGPAGSAAQLFELMETEHFTEAEMKNMIGELRRQTTASMELLQSLFDWGKAQLQGIKVNTTDFNPVPIMGRCLDLLARQAANKRVTISHQLQEHLYVHADADHFEFVVRNLLSNAIKFSHEGGRIEMGAHSDGKKKEVVFSVKDQGIGISKQQQEVFRGGNLQVNFGTKKEKGSGLGLLLAKDFMKANRGRIWLDSQEGRGTTFYFSLPLAV